MNKKQKLYSRVNLSCGYLLKISACMIIFLGGCCTFAGKVSFNPSFGIEETYNENIFFLDRYKAADFIASLTADFAFEISNPSKKLKLSYSPYTEFYRKYNDLNNTGHNFISTYDFRGKTSDLRISEIYSLTQSQGVLLDYQGFPMSVLPRTDITSNYLDLSYGLRIRDISIINFKIGHWLSRYKDIPPSESGPGFNFENTGEFYSSIENLFALGRINNKMGYFVDFKKFLYETVPDQTSNALGLIYKYESIKKMNVTMKIGGFKVGGEDFGQDNRIRALFYFDMSKNIKRGEIAMNLSRDAGTIRGLGESSINNRLSIRFSYPLTALSSLKISSAYYKNEPFEEGKFVKYDAFAVGSSLDFKMYKKLSLSVSHRYFSQNSKEDNTLNAAFNVFSLSLRINPFNRSY